MQCGIKPHPSKPYTPWVSVCALNREIIDCCGLGGVSSNSSLCQLPRKLCSDYSIHTVYLSMQEQCSQ